MFNFKYKSKKTSKSMKNLVKKWRAETLHFNIYNPLLVLDFMYLVSICTVNQL